MRSSYHSVNRWLRNTSDPDDSVHSSLHGQQHCNPWCYPRTRWNARLLSGTAYHDKNISRLCTAL